MVLVIFVLDSSQRFAVVVLHDSRSSPIGGSQCSSLLFLAEVRFASVCASLRVLKLFCSFLDNAIDDVLRRSNPVVKLIILHTVDEPFLSCTFTWNIP